jgi:hypothetical protein
MSFLWGNSVIQRTQDNILEDMDIFYGYHAKKTI